MYLPVSLGDAGLVELLARDHGAAAALLEHGAQDVVGEHVELLDLLALHVGLARVAEHAGEAGGAHARVDDAHGEGDRVEERRELARWRPGAPRVPAVMRRLEGGADDGGAAGEGGEGLGHGVSASALPQDGRPLHPSRPAGTLAAPWPQPPTA